GRRGSPPSSRDCAAAPRRPPWGGTGNGDRDVARRAERPGVRRPGGRVDRGPVPGERRRPSAAALAAPRALQPPHRARRSARQRHRLRQPPRSPPRRAGARRSAPGRGAHPRHGRRRGLRPGRRARPDAPRTARARGRPRPVRAAQAGGPRRLQREGKLGVPDAPGRMTEDAIAGGRLERLVPALERLTGARLRVWRFDGQAVRPLAPDPEISPTWTPPLNGQDAGRRLDTPQGPAWFAPVREADGGWLQGGEQGDGASGMEPKTVDPIEVDDPCSVAARVFREMRIVSYDPTDAKAVNPGCPEGRNYRGQAFLSVPVLYAAPGARGRPIGVINLTDRL